MHVSNQASGGVSAYLESGRCLLTWSLYTTPLDRMNDVKTVHSSILRMQSVNTTTMDISIMLVLDDPCTG